MTARLILASLANFGIVSPRRSFPCYDGNTFQRGPQAIAASSSNTTRSLLPVPISDLTTSHPALWAAESGVC